MCVLVFNAHVFHTFASVCRSNNLNVFMYIYIMQKGERLAFILCPLAFYNLRFSISKSSPSADLISTEFESGVWEKCLSIVCWLEVKITGCFKISVTIISFLHGCVRNRSRI